MYYSNNDYYSYFDILIIDIFDIFDIERRMTNLSPNNIPIEFRRC